MRILVSRKLPPLAQKRLESLRVQVTQWPEYDTIMDRQVLLKECREQDGLLVMLTDKIDKQLIDTTKAKYISTMSVGMDHIDLKYCDTKQIKVFNTPDVLTDATADLALTLILALSRNIPAAMDSVVNGTWGVWNPIGYCGQQLRNKTVGIIGMGRIGMGIAERLLPFKINKILYTGTRDQQLENLKFVTLNELLVKSDIVIISCALNEQTKYMFDLDTFKQMKRSSMLINIARGPIIKQDDLVKALELGYIAQAGLDVTDPEPIDPQHPLITKFRDKVVIFPHIGSATMETREAMASLALDQLIDALGIESY